MAVVVGTDWTLHEPVVGWEGVAGKGESAVLIWVVRVRSCFRCHQTGLNFGEVGDTLGDLLILIFFGWGLGMGWGLCLWNRPITPFHCFGRVRGGFYSLHQIICYFIPTPRGFRLPLHLALPLTNLNSLLVIHLFEPSGWLSSYFLQFHSVHTLLGLYFDLLPRLFPPGFFHAISIFWFIQLQFFRLRLLLFHVPSDGVHQLSKDQSVVLLPSLWDRGAGFGIPLRLIAARLSRLLPVLPLGKLLILILNKMCVTFLLKNSLSW